MKFSKQVKCARQQLKLSQMAFAKEVGVSFTSINRWENGHTEPQDLVKKVFYEFCKMHGVNLQVTKSEPNVF